MDPQITSPSRIDCTRLDEDAVRAVERLQSRGAEAYLVGGCVRDHLLQRAPKDYDIATSARPAQVKRTFARNCRIIGRRFKLAHLHYDQNRKILEVSTFRRAPSPDDNDEQQDTPTDADLLITRDNEFGSAEEDAMRRDFTVNALFHDPIQDRILDYVDGIRDLENRVIRTIGDPVVRFREDPVRILRAIKFCSRLGFSLDPKTFDAMVEVAPDLVRAAPPRMLEEILRLLRGGHALDAFQLLRDIGALAVILPTVDDYLLDTDATERRRFWRLLESLDGRVRSGRRPANGVLLGALFLRPVLTQADDEPDRSVASVAEDVVQPFAVELRLPKRDTGCLKRICSVHHRFTATGKKKFRPIAFRQDPFFSEALDLFALTCAATGQDSDLLASWQNRTEQVEGGQARGARQDRGRSNQSREGGGKSKSRNRDRNQHDKRGKQGASDSGRGKVTDNRKQRKRKQDKPAYEIETLEPESIDVSAFDIELSSKRAPSFGTIVESAGGGGAKKRRKNTYRIEDDDYKPPPPPTGAPGSDTTPDGPMPPPPPSSDGDSFGDW